MTRFRAYNTLRETEIADVIVMYEELQRRGPKHTEAVGPPKKAELHFTGRRMLIGRNADCDLVLEDPRVSRTHVEIMGSIRSTVLRDLGSTNGTRVNGKFVTASRLKDGDVIEFGISDIALVFRTQQDG